jgi:hypothetical protein
MRKTRVKFKVKGSKEIQIGYLACNKLFKNGFCVRTVNKKDAYCISTLKMIERI